MAEYTYPAWYSRVALFSFLVPLHYSILFQYRLWTAPRFHGAPFPWQVGAVAIALGIAVPVWLLFGGLLWFLRQRLGKSFIIDGDGITRVSGGQAVHTDFKEVTRVRNGWLSPLVLEWPNGSLEVSANVLGGLELTDAVLEGVRAVGCGVDDTVAERARKIASVEDYSRKYAWVFLGTGAALAVESLMFGYPVFGSFITGVSALAPPIEAVAFIPVLVYFMGVWLLANVLGTRARAGRAAFAWLGALTPAVGILVLYLAVVRLFAAAKGM